MFFTRAGSLLCVTHPIGCFLSGIVQEKFGKKRCMIIANVPGVVAWLLLYSAHHSVQLCASALLMGFGTGFGAGSTSSYVGEISEPRLRGSLGALGSAGIRLGTFSVFAACTFFDWRSVTLWSALCPLTCACLVLCVSRCFIIGSHSEAIRII